MVLLDGLTRAAAHGAALDALCARGLDVVVDVGFPTKSMTVQRVLWTGLTAQQSGAAARNVWTPVPPGAVPAAVPGSVAVVEAYRPIAGSFGFTRLEPDAAADSADAAARPDAVAAWRDHGFAAAARDAVAGDAPLVLVHVLAIDEAGHRGGPGTVRYRAAVARADALLGELVAAAPHARWLVTSDHGHVAGGGHGDVEDVVRRVRACVAPALARGPRGRPVASCTSSIPRAGWPPRSRALRATRARSAARCRWRSPTPIATPRCRVRARRGAWSRRWSRSPAWAWRSPGRGRARPRCGPRRPS
ncbi:MAG: alkaline phosphatase family protein [Kofleriaceae bacterium]|nr:alkaline phosphatase family protein [Kofleriaceae bacterium]